MSRYKTFDRGRIELKGLSIRCHDLTVDACLPLEPPIEPLSHGEFRQLLGEDNGTQLISNASIVISFLGLPCERRVCCVLELKPWCGFGGPAFVAIVLLALNGFAETLSLPLPAAPG